KQDDDRYRQLALSSAGSRQNAERASAQADVAQSGVVSSAAALDAAKQQLTVLDADIAEGRAEVAQAEADLRTAELNLGYTEIRSPIDGYVGNRAAEVGAYVAGGAYLITVIPAHDLWVDANFNGWCRDKQRRSSPMSCRTMSFTAVSSAWPRPRPCRQLGPGHGRRLQRHPARERDRQLHQDRSARPCPHQAGRRRDAPCASGRAVDNCERGHAIGFGGR